MEVQQARQEQGGSSGQGGGYGAGRGTIDHRATGAWPQDGAADGAQERRANALGWFSIGLGVAQLTAPGGVARLIGVRDDDGNRAVMRTVGLREIASGVGILSRPRPAGWLWTRVAGDLMDLALLGKALGSDENRKGRVAAATAAVAGITLVDMLTSEQLSRSTNGLTSGTAPDGSHRVVKSLTINRPAAELYALCRDVQNMPRYSSRLESVQSLGDHRYRWRMRGPAGSTVDLEVEIVDDQPNERIAWQTVEGAPVRMRGVTTLQAADGGKGTVIRDEIYLDPPGGGVGSAIVRFLSGVLEQQVLEDLRRFKQIAETGEVVLSDAKVGGGERPAQPPPRELIQQRRSGWAGEAGAASVAPATGGGNR